jgi:integrase
LKPGLIIFRRSDVKHRKWYCRIKVPDADRYKTVSLKTEDIDAARARAFDQDADVRFRIKREVPIFNRPFSEIAKDFIALQEQRKEAGQITARRLQVVGSIIPAQLNRYVGNVQITLIGQDRWLGYPLWRQQNGKGRNGRVSDATIRYEMSIFRSIMAYAASKKFISDSPGPPRMGADRRRAPSSRRNNPRARGRGETRNEKTQGETLACFSIQPARRINASSLDAPK